MGQSLGEFEQLVLLALIRLGADAYGATILREIEERAKRSVSVGGIYTTLERLERKGYVRSAVGGPSPERGGRRKKFYTLLPAGRRVLRHSLEAIRRLSEDLAEELETLR